MTLGDIAGGNGSVKLGNGNTLAKLSVDSAKDLAIYTGGAFSGEAVRIASNGNVGIGTTTPGVSLDISAKTDAVALPKGTTAQQPASPVSGWIRYNTSNNAVEFYDGSAWTTLAAAGGSYLSTSGGTLSGNLTVSSGGLTVSAGGASISGGINNNSGGITSAGSITGVGANITGSGAMTVAAGGAAQNLTLSSSTTGSVNVGSGNGTSLSVLDGGASTVNYVTVQGAATGSSPVIATAGADTNINLTLTPKGTGNTIFSSGNVGIGTTAPADKLQVGGNAIFGVAGTGSGTNSITVRADSGASNVDLFNINFQRSSYDPTGTAASITFARTTGGSEGVIAFKTNSGRGNTERMRIMETGKVGIGTTSPGESLTIAGVTSYNTGIKLTGNSNGGTGLSLENTSASGRKFSLFSTGSSNTPGVGNFAIWDDTASSYRLVINSSGNLGIGTTAPSSRLDVNGSVRVGTDATVCAASIQGSIRMNGTALEYCNGSSWTALASGTGITALTGDVTASGTGSVSATVTKVNGGSIPISAALVATNASGQLTSVSTVPTSALPAFTGGDVTSSAGSLALTLTNSGATAGTYSKVTVDAKGRVTSGASLASGDIATALGYTPVNRAGDTMTGGLNLPSNGLTVGTSQMVVSGGNVGIGTTSPATKFQVAGSVMIGDGGETCGASYAGAVRYNSGTIQFSNGSSWTILSTGGAGTYLSSGGGTLSGALTISSGGASITGGINNNSGGITNAGSVTGVGANITGSGALTVAAGGTNQNLTLNSSGTGTVNLGSANGTSLSVLDGGTSTVNYVTIKGAASGASPTIATAGGDANINLNFTPKGAGNTIFSSGNVGIGTTAPGQKLSVAGTIESTSGGFKFPDGSIQATATVFRQMSTGYVTVPVGSIQPMIGASTPSNRIQLLVQLQSASDDTSALFVIQGAAGFGHGFWYNIQPLALGGNTSRLYVKRTGYYYDIGVAAVGASNSLKVSVMALSDDLISFTNTTTNAAVTESSNGDIYSLQALNIGGNVGIGTATPGYKLDVQGGDINASGSVRAAGVALEKFWKVVDGLNQET